MAEHVVDELYSYAQGHLSQSEVTRVEEHLRQCGECQREADELDRLGASLSGPPAAVLSTLHEQLAGAGRFEHLLERLAKLFDFSVADARALVARIDDPTYWEIELAPGVWVGPVAAGPNVKGTLATLVKLAPGAQFPEHAHGAEEQVLILEGGYRDVSGTEFWRGELDARAKGTSHAFTGLPGLACICASVTTPPEAEA